MQFLTAIFGGTENTLATAAIALGIVLVLIVLSVWVLKFFFRASTRLASGANRRLAVVDTVAIDPKRQLVIVRRDDVEHLILTGGPQDLVVESGIAAPKPALGRRRASTATPSESIAETSQPEPAATPAPMPAKASDHLERLREMARPLAQRTSHSLRHTGLMRPVSRLEPAAIIPINPDNSDTRRVDSAKTGSNETRGSSRVGSGTYLGDGA